MTDSTKSYPCGEFFNSTPEGLGLENQIRISVALCTHNGARFIEAQIESILNQILLPIEILVFDDDSVDNTINIIRSVEVKHSQYFGSRSPLLRIIRNPQRLGVSKNFEQSLRACNGDLIALCDQDDIWTRDRLKLIANLFLAKPDLTLVHGNASLINAEGRSLGYSLFEALEVSNAELRSISEGRAFDVFLRRNLVTGATTVIRKSLLIAALPIPPGWLHDEWLAVIAAATGSVSFTDALTVSYRQHDANQIGVKRHTLLMKTKSIFCDRRENLIINLRKNGSLLDRLIQISELVLPGKVEKLQQRIAYQAFRIGLPTNRLMRLVPVMRAVFSGVYHRFGRGWLTVARDILIR